MNYLYSTPTHPRIKTFVNIPLHLIEIAGTWCRAAILAVVERFTKSRIYKISKIVCENVKLKKLGLTLQKVPNLWLYERAIDFQEAGVVFNRKTIYKALDNLVKRGFLEVMPSPDPRDTTKMYRLNSKVYQQEIKKWKKADRENSEAETPVVDASPLGDFGSPIVDFDPYLLVSHKTSPYIPLELEEEKQREKKMEDLRENQNPEKEVVENLGVGYQVIDTYNPSLNPQEAARSSGNKYQVIEGYNPPLQAQEVPFHQTSKLGYENKQSSSAVNPNLEMGTNVPAARGGDKFFGNKPSRYQSWGETEHGALVYSKGTPWLREPSQVQKIRFDSKFVEWGGREFQKSFGTEDIYKARANFTSSLLNNPEKIAVRWEEYCNKFAHKATTIAARKNNGVTVAPEEIAEIEEHQIAIAGFLGSEENSLAVDQKIIASANAIVNPPVLEADSAIPDDVFARVQMECSDLEQQAVKIPEGADNVSAYKIANVDSDWIRQKAEAYAAKVKESVQKAPPKSGPSPELKIKHWTNLINTGNETIINKVVDQVNAHPDYEIVRDVQGKPTTVKYL